MLNKVIALIGTCVLSLSVHADIYNFNGIITNVTGPDVPYNIGDQYNFSIEIDYQSQGYRNIGNTVETFFNTATHIFYAAEYISGDAVENVGWDSWTNHYYEEPTSSGGSVANIAVLNNLAVIAPGIRSIDLWDTDTNLLFYQDWRNASFVGNHIQGQITSFTVFHDIDTDGVEDSLDNCTLEANTDQRDSNGDGFGNACDPDLDNNGIVNFGDISAWVPFFNTPCGDVDQDLDGNGNCDFGDYALFPAYFQQPPGPSGLAP